MTTMTNTTPNKKAIQPIDKHVGSRIRMRRMQLSMSQEKLGDGCNLTFQQIQKYEKGANRVGASRLVQIAGLLQVPPAFFFEGAPDVGKVKHTVGNLDDDIQEFLTSNDGLMIIRNWKKLTKGVQGNIADLVEQIAEVPKSKQAK